MSSIVRRAGKPRAFSPYKKHVKHPVQFGTVLRATSHLLMAMDADKMRTAWYQLRQADGKAFGSTDEVTCVAKAAVAHLRKRVKQARPNDLAHLDPPHLIVYANQATWDNKHQPLTSGALLGALGSSENDPLVVIVPPDDLPLRALWKHSELKEMPSQDKLAALLQQQLPFQLVGHLGMFHDDTTAMFNPEGPLVQCRDLSAVMERFFSVAIDGSVDATSWQTVYDLLLDIPLSLLKDRGCPIRVMRKRIDDLGMGAKLRPDFLLHYLGMVLFRGEESTTCEAVDPCNALLAKMRLWNPLFYGDLPYIMGYAACGPRLQVVAIDRQLQATTIVEFYSILEQPTQVVQTFYNLTFVLLKIATVTTRTASTRLLPFEPDVTDMRTIELRDYVVERTIAVAQCASHADFERRVHIYTVLAALSGCGEPVQTHLQRVQALVVRGNALCVHLSPIGVERKPQGPAQVRVWLRGILTALTYWHRCGYCHGDLRWSNFVYVVGSDDDGYWVLIDMDESRKPNTTTIDWYHPFRGHKLCFQHDLYQLGKLFTEFTLPQDLVSIRAMLLAALQPASPATVTAQQVLAKMAECSADPA